MSIFSQRRAVFHFFQMSRSFWGFQTVDNTVQLNLPPLRPAPYPAITFFFGGVLFPASSPPSSLSFSHTQVDNCMKREKKREALGGRWGGVSYGVAAEDVRLI